MSRCPFVAFCSCLCCLLPPPPLNRGDVAFDFVLFCLKSGTLPKGVSMGGLESVKQRVPVLLHSDLDLEMAVGDFALVCGVVAESACYTFLRTWLSFSFFME